MNYKLEYTIAENEINEKIVIGKKEDKDPGFIEIDEYNYTIFPSIQWVTAKLTCKEVEGIPIIENLENKEDQRVNAMYSDVTKVELSFNEPPTDLSFKNMSLLKSIRQIDITHLTNGNSMFNNCENLMSIEVPLDVSKLTNMAYMFNNCKKLERLQLAPYDENGMWRPDFNTLTDMTYMMNECKALVDHNIDVAYIIEEGTKRLARGDYMSAFNGDVIMVADYYFTIPYPWRELNLNKIFIKPKLELRTGVTKSLRVLYEPQYVPHGYNNYENNPDAKFKWSCDNENINLDVSDDKKSVKITAKDVIDNAVIQVSQINESWNLYDVCEITVLKNEKHILIEPPYPGDVGYVTKTDEANQTVYAKIDRVYGEKDEYAMKFKVNTKEPVTWSSSNTSIATIDKTGKIAVLNPGKTTIRCSLKNNKKVFDEYKLVIQVLTEGIKFPNDTYTVSLDKDNIGWLIVPEVIITPENAKDSTELVYTLSNEYNETKEVYPKEQVLLREQGKWKLECKAINNDVVDPCYADVIVNKLATSIYFDDIGIREDHTMEMERGSKLTLFYETVPEDADNKSAYYHVDNPRVVTLDKENNTITAVNIGTAYVYVILNSDRSIYDRFKLIVTLPIDEVVVEPVEQIEIGKEKQLKYDIYPADSTQTAFKWESSNPAVIKVDQNGKITAIGLGTADITVTSIYDRRVFDTISIYVKGYDLEYDIAPNNSDRELVDYLPIDKRSQGCIYEVTDTSGNCITGKLSTIKWKMNKIAHVKCSYPTDEISFTFEGNNLISKLTVCEIPIINADNIFKNCTNLQYVCNLPGKIESINGTFEGCINLKEIPIMDTTHIIRAVSAFKGCRSLEKSELILPNVLSCNQMYRDCNNLKNIDILGSYYLNDIDYIVYGCVSLMNVNEVRLGKTDGYKLFEGLTNLTNVGLVSANCSNNCSYMFNGCVNLKEIPKFNIHEYTFIACSYMFNNCISMKGTPIAKQFWQSNCRLSSECFTNCTKLSNYYTEIPSYWGGQAMVQSIYLDRYEEKFLTEGDKFTITAHSIPDYAIDISYQWTIDDPTVATIYPKNEKCYVVVKGPGSTIIHCIHGNMEKTFNILSYTVDEYIFDNPDSLVKVKEIFNRENYEFIDAYDRDGNLLRFEFLRVHNVLERNRMILDMVTGDLSKIKVYYIDERTNKRLITDSRESLMTDKGEWIIYNDNYGD